MNDEGTGTVGWIVHGSQRQRSRSRWIRYLVLYVIVVFGVAGGILLANWITAKNAQDPDERAAAQGRSVTETDAGLAQKAGQVASKVGSEINTVIKQVTAKVTGGVASSETARELAQQCDDWTRAYEQGHTKTARAEMDKYCGRYKTYLATGNTSQ